MVVPGVVACMRPCRHEPARLAHSRLPIAPNRAASPVRTCAAAHPPRRAPARTGRAKPPPLGWLQACCCCRLKGCCWGRRPAGAAAAAAARRCRSPPLALAAALRVPRAAFGLPVPPVGRQGGLAPWARVLGVGGESECVCGCGEPTEWYRKLQHSAQTPDQRLQARTRLGGSRAEQGRGTHTL